MVDYCTRRRPTTRGDETKKYNNYLGDDGRLLGHLGRLGGDDGGEGELGRERRGEHCS